MNHFEDNVEKSMEKLQQARAVVSRIKIRLQNYIDKHENIKNYYRYYNCDTNCLSHNWKF